MSSTFQRTSQKKIRTGAPLATRQFRVAYSEPNLARLVLETLPLWRDLETEAKKKFVNPTGCLWFGDANRDTTEGQIAAAIEQLKKLGVEYEEFKSADEIQARFPLFAHLPATCTGVFTPYGGPIDVPTLRASLCELLRRSSKCTLRSSFRVTTIHPYDHGVLVGGQDLADGSKPTVLRARKVIVCAGPYTNDVLESLDLQLQLYQMPWTSTYFAVKGPHPSDQKVPVWFYFGSEKKDSHDGNLYYGFPSEDGELMRVAPAYLSEVSDIPPGARVPPASERKFDKQALRFTAAWIKEHMPRVDPTLIPAKFSTCMATRTPDEDFVLDFLPPSVPFNKNVVVFAAGWGMKFVPLFGRICSDLVVDGKTCYNISKFSLQRAGIVANPYLKYVDRGLPSPVKTKKVLVIGAGVSGLVSATLLAERGHNVTIMEHSKQPGGRVKTHYFDKDKKLHAELGAMRIPEGHPLVNRFIEKLKLETIRFPMEGEDQHKGQTFIMANGHRLRRVDYERFPDRLGFETEGIEKSKDADTLFNLAVRSIAEQGANGWQRVLARFDKHSIRSFLSQETFYSEGAIEMMNVLLNMESISFTGFIESVRDQADINISVNYNSIVGGNQQLTDALVARCSSVNVNIMCNTAVTSLRATNDGVVVQFKSSQGDAKELTFDEVIVTAPFPMLRHIAHEPRFSAQKERAIREVHYDQSTKIFLQFKRAWWMDQGISGGYSITDNPLRFVYYPKIAEEDKEKPAVLLASYTWGDDALRWDPYNDDDIATRALQYLEELHGKQGALRPLHEATCVQKWAADPCVGGAFALFTSEQQSLLYEGIIASEWQDRVHFAGEHTTLTHAWIEGAIESGIRAALRVNHPPKTVVKTRRAPDEILAEIRYRLRLACTAVSKHAKPRYFRVQPGPKSQVLLSSSPSFH